jgi:hypothetical protein
MSMIRRFRWTAIAILALVVPGGSLSAQFHYPGGYGGYGWGGWGGGGGSTVYGDQARGMGMLAAGAGVYNQQTAVARSINANTAMNWNEYIWQSQQQTNARYAQKMAKDRAELNQTAESLQNRLRNNPSDRDIMRGDALNVALDELTSPRVYLRALQGAKAKFPGTMIREMPFQYASAAITTSVDSLLQNPPPKLLTQPEFAASRAALREVRTKFRAQADAMQDIDPALIAEAKRLIKSMDKILTDNPEKYPKFSPQVQEASKYLKGLYGLVTMLESPAINVLLAGVEKRPDTTVADLLGFMQAFNLRFGIANTPGQRMAYSQLYPVLDGLRDELAGPAPAPTTAQAPLNPSHPAQFFSGMNYEHLDAKHTAQAPAPAPPSPRP